VKTFACGDVVPGCSHSFTAPDEGGIFGLVAAHAVADHGLHEITPDLVAAVHAAIR
jgi:predicted small metal-binding protein